MSLYSATLACLPTVPYPTHWPLILWLIPLTIFLQIPLPSVTTLHSFQHFISVASVSTRLFRTLCNLYISLLFVPKCFLSVCATFCANQNHSVLLLPICQIFSCYFVFHCTCTEGTLANTNGLTGLHHNAGSCGCVALLYARWGSMWINGWWWTVHL